MKIAIAGTHRIGKTTLAEAFAAARPDYRLEPEPYVALIELGEEPADDRTLESFERQLAFHGERVAALAAQPDVLFDRCAADLLAYMKAAPDLDGGALPDDAIEAARDALHGIDLIVYLPLRSSPGFVADDDDARYRRVVDRHLAGILDADELGLFDDSRAPRIETLGGSTAKRLRRLVACVDRFGSGVGPVF